MRRLGLGHKLVAALFEHFVHFVGILAQRLGHALANLRQQRLVLPIKLRLERDEQVQRELLRQLDRTNAVLEQLTEPNWFQRTVLGKKGRPVR